MTSAPVKTGLSNPVQPTFRQVFTGRTLWGIDRIAAKVGIH